MANSGYTPLISHGAKSDVYTLSDPKIHECRVPQTLSIGVHLTSARSVERRPSAVPIFLWQRRQRTLHHRGHQGHEGRIGVEAFNFLCVLCGGSPLCAFARESASIRVHLRFLGRFVDVTLLLAVLCAPASLRETSAVTLTLSFSVSLCLCRYVLRNSSPDSTPWHTVSSEFAPLGTPRPLKLASKSNVVFRLGKTIFLCSWPHRVK